MASGWTVVMGPSGGVLNDYRGYADIRFVDPLYDYGAAQVVLTSLDGFAAPAAGWVVKLVYDKGLASEQVHWKGVVSDPGKKQQGNVYVIQAYTLDGLLNVNQTGGVRNYLAKTPHQIIQAAGTPNPLLRNAQGSLVMAYGAAAGVPNKVEATSDRMGSFSGTIANDQFVAHSKTLLDNVKRLCWQARYTNDGAPDGSSDGDLDGSYGLEWTTTLEGGNSSTPTFYLVKRRERSSGYTPEVFIVPTDMHRSKRSNATFPGVDTVIVVGGGDGNSRVASAVAGAGSREITLDDKAIYKSANADNFAQRALQVYGVTTEAIMGVTSRHASPTRAGDTVTIQQTGHANLDVRVIARFYDTTSKMFTYQLGRPQPKTRELLQGQLGFSASVGTAPQFTDTKPESFEDGVQYITVASGAPITIPAHTAATIFLDSATMGVGGGSLTNLGKSEGFWLKLDLVVDAAVDRILAPAAHTLKYDKTTSITLSSDNSGNAGADPHTHTATPNHTNTAVTGAYIPKLAGPFQVGAHFVFAGPFDRIVYLAVFPHLEGGLTYFDTRVYPFASRGAAGDYTPTRFYVDLRNDGDIDLVLNAGTRMQVFQNTIHRHNEVA